VAAKTTNRLLLATVKSLIDQTAQKKVFMGKNWRGLNQNNPKTEIISGAVAEFPLKIIFQRSVDWQTFPHQTNQTNHHINVQINLIFGFTKMYLSLLICFTRKCQLFDTSLRDYF